MASIIIPVHNEASVLASTLNSILLQMQDEDELIVVCNGCTDDSADIARSLSSKLTVIETSIPSKVNALNLGDKLAGRFPRLYIDADIRLSDGALGKICDSLRPGGYLAASAEPVMDFEGASWAVKAYYQIWLSLPYSKVGMMGAGMYALSEEARQRFDEFPEIIADDGYVRALFKEHERGNVANAYAYVRAPVNLHWLLKIKMRSRLGTMEFVSRYPELIDNEAKDYKNAIFSVLKNPLNWPKAFIYLYVNLISRLGAKRRFKKLDQYQWERDLSTRQD